ncbi:MAG: hypothetical protein R3B90_11010 [Planctomycetaceae bacterium]
MNRFNDNDSRDPWRRDFDDADDDDTDDDDDLSDDWGNEPASGTPWGLIAALGGGVLVVCGLLVTGFLIVRQRQHAAEDAAAAFRDAESSDEKFQQAALAFQGEAVPDDDARIEPLRELLGHWLDSFGRKDVVLLREQVDTHRMMQEVLRTTGLTMTPAQMRQVEPVMSLNLPSQLISQAELYTYDRFEIRKAEFNATGDEAMLFVRMWQGDDVSVKFRFWCVQRTGAWKVYDFEDLSSSMRFSDLGGAGFVIGYRTPERLPALRSAMLRMTEATMAILQEDYGTAAQALDAMDTTHLPDPLKAMWHMQHSLVAMSNADWQQSLDDLAAAERLHPDMLITRYLRSITFNNLERYEEAATEARAFIDKLGGDPQASVELVAALQSLDRNDEALAAARAGLDDDPTSVDLLHQLAWLIPDEGGEEFARRFMGLAHPDEHFDMLCGQLEERPLLLDAVVRGYAEKFPDDIDVGYWSAVVDLAQERPELALEKLRPLLPKIAADDPDLWAFRNLYHRAAVAADSWKEVFEAATDKREAFAELTAQMADEQHRAAKRQLVELYAPHGEVDPWLYAVRGELAAANEDWETAISEYRRGYELEQQAGTSNDESLTHYELLRVMAQAGREIEALREIAPTDLTFGTLMYQVTPDRRQKLLDEFLSQHAATPASSYWQAEAQYAAGDYAAALATIDDAAQVFADDSYYAASGLRTKFRTLLKLDRIDEAKQVTDQLQDEYDWLVLLATIDAVEGDVEATSQHLQAAVDSFYFTPEEFYDVEILGELLLTEPFAALREKFPPAANNDTATEEKVTKPMSDAVPADSPPADAAPANTEPAEAA